MPILLNQASRIDPCSSWTFACVCRCILPVSFPEMCVDCRCGWLCKFIPQPRQRKGDRSCNQSSAPVYLSKNQQCSFLLEKRRLHKPRLFGFLSWIACLRQLMLSVLIPWQLHWQNFLLMYAFTLKHLFFTPVNPHFSFDIYLFPFIQTGSSNLEIELCAWIQTIIAKKKKVFSPITALFRYLCYLNKSAKTHSVY